LIRDRHSAKWQECESCERQNANNIESKFCSVWNKHPKNQKTDLQDFFFLCFFHAEQDFDWCEKNPERQNQQ
jgi:hypothetical protein